jgi:hypothetical protein
MPLTGAPSEILTGGLFKGCGGGKLSNSCERRCCLGTVLRAECGKTYVAATQARPETSHATRQTFRSTKTGEDAPRQ